MEPITTSAMIGTLTGYLAKKLRDNKSVQDFFSDFTEAAVNWIRPIFLKEDDKPKESLEILAEKPESEARQKAIASTIEVALEDNPGAKALLKEMYEIIKAKESRGEAISIVGSQNVVAGSTLKAGGNIIIGDSNTTNDPK